MQSQQSVSSELGSEASRPSEQGELLHHDGSELFDLRHEIVKLLGDTLVDSQLVLDYVIEEVVVLLLALHELKSSLHLDLNVLEKEFNLLVPAVHDYLVIILVIEVGREDDGSELLGGLHTGEVLEDLKAFQVHFCLVAVEVGLLVVVDLAEGALDDSDHEVQANNKHEHDLDEVDDKDDIHVDIEYKGVLAFIFLNQGVDIRKTKLAN